jgi:hypothetical protein
VPAATPGASFPLGSLLTHVIDLTDNFVGFLAQGVEGVEGFPDYFYARAFKGLTGFYLYTLYRLAHNHRNLLGIFPFFVCMAYRSPTITLHTHGGRKDVARMSQGCLARKWLSGKDEQGWQGCFLLLITIPKILALGLKHPCHPCCAQHWRGSCLDRILATPLRFSPHPCES